MPFPAPRFRTGLMEKLTEASYREMFLSWTIINLTFAVAYFSIAIVAPGHGPNFPAELTPLEKLLDSVYFSVITATSVGYGDLVPLGISKALAMVQSILTLMVFAVFVTKLVTRRQDLVLFSVHRMSMKSAFTNLRSGLFIIRKDFDRTIADAKDGKMTENEWENLTSAYVQAQSLLEEIPDFYESYQIEYRIDRNRESLLLEAVERTLRRIDTMLETMEKVQIDWRAHEPSRVQLEELIALTEEIIEVWRERSPHRAANDFRGTVEMERALRERIAGGA